MTHLPTGTVVECQRSLAQHKNKARALAVLGRAIKAKQVREQQAKTAAERKSLVGSGDRSERIRTYNFPRAAYSITASISRCTRSRRHHGR